MSPVEFWRELACLDSKGRKLTGSNASVRGLHVARPHGRDRRRHTTRTRAARARRRATSGGANDITLASIGRLYLWLDRGARAGRCRSGLPIYATEYGFQTNPPDRTRACR